MRTPNKGREAHSNVIQTFGPKAPITRKTSQFTRPKNPHKVSIGELALSEKGYQINFNFNRWEGGEVSIRKKEKRAGNPHNSHPDR